MLPHSHAAVCVMGWVAIDTDRETSAANWIQIVGHTLWNMEMFFVFGLGGGGGLAISISRGYIQIYLLYRVSYRSFRGHTDTA